MISNCCGHDMCKDFETFFCQVKKLLPPFYDGLICEGGVYERLVEAKARAFYDDIYVDQLCRFLCEANPATSTCMIDRHMQELGLPDECINVCGIDPEQYPDEYRISVSAQVKIYQYMRFNKVPNAEMIDFIASVFGLKVRILAPTVHGLEFENRGCSIVMECHDECIPEGCEPMGLIMDNVGCADVNNRIIIDIMEAPAKLYATQCSYAGDDVCCQTFVETFKCMVNKYIKIAPISYSDSWMNVAPVPLPTYLLEERTCA